MACTTLLVGAKATYDGSTIIARNEDCEDGVFDVKGLVLVDSADQPRTYTGVISHLTIPLPDDPVAYSSVPNVDRSIGIWGEAGVNAHNVAMSATETITTNAQVLGADPLVVYRPATDAQPERPGGLGEEDLLTIVLPYITSAREGVERLGGLLEKYGTYEENGVAFADGREVWYLETVGGHHWIARRVPDDCYVVQPNQLGIDAMDLTDAYGERHDFMASADLARWMAAHHLAVDRSHGDGPSVDGVPARFNPRLCFGSATWRDQVYNTPRAWAMMRRLNPSDSYDGPDARWQPEALDLPWARVPEKAITIADVKAVESDHYQGTAFDPYGTKGDAASRRRYRPIGINRNCELSVLQVRPDGPRGLRAIQWVAYGSNPFNTLVPFLPHGTSVPAYLETHDVVDTAELYWQCRLIAALGDPEYRANASTLDQYQMDTLGASLAALAALDDGGTDDPATVDRWNRERAEAVRTATDALLTQMLLTRSLAMANRFDMGDH